MLWEKPKHEIKSTSSRAERQDLEKTEKHFCCTEGSPEERASEMEEVWKNQSSVKRCGGLYCYFEGNRAPFFSSPEPSLQWSLVVVAQAGCASQQLGWGNFSVLRENGAKYRYKTRSIELRIPNWAEGCTSSMTNLENSVTSYKRGLEPDWYPVS